MPGKIEGKREEGSRGQVVGWHHRFNGRKRGQTPGDREEQGGLASCSPRGHKESDTTATELQWMKGGAIH